MTCFWDGLLAQLSQDDIMKYLPIDGLGGTRQQVFIRGLKKWMQAHTGDHEVRDVMWNGEPITQQQMEEFRSWVLGYNEMSMDGHDCSIMDPFLVLVCHIWIVNIKHNYMGVDIMYTNRGAVRTLTFGSNNGHFW